MIKSSGFYLIVIVLSVGQAYSQSYVESAMVFSRTRPGGSARIQGIGGTQIALGGDYSSAYSNPAGLGMYNRSEFAITPGYRSRQMNTTYFGNESSNTESDFHVPGFAIVLHLPKQNQSYLGGSFALTMNKTNDFNSVVSYGGVNPNTSLIDYFIDDANGYTTQQFEVGEYQYNRPTGLAYFNYLIGPVSLIDPSDPNGDITYFTDVMTIPTQREDINTSGASYQWNLAYGGNYDDRVFFGASIGISSLKFESNKFFSESFTDNLFYGFDLEENLSVQGTGINVTLGITGRPLDNLQIGLAYRSPTFYDLTETYYADMTARWKNFDYYGDGSVILRTERAYTDEVVADYTLQTPSQVSAGVAFISKMGFLSADVEFMNLEKAKYGSNMDGISFDTENEDIGAVLRPTTNFRLGGEFRYEVWRVRAGFGLMANTYNDQYDIENKITTLSAGGGFRSKGFYVDFAWSLSTSNYPYFPYSFYSPGYVTPVVDVESSYQNVLVTLGMTF